MSKTQPPEFMYLQIVFINILTSRNKISREDPGSNAEGYSVLFQVRSEPRK